MRLHDRYIFRELLTPLLFCLGGLTVFWVSAFFFREMTTIQENKFTFLDTVEYCAANLPEFFVLILPIALLLALLYALTHHGKHNEITALRAAGISLWRLSGPYFVVGLVATGIVFALNEFAMPRCQRWAQEIEVRHLKADASPKIKTKFTKTGFRNLTARRVWQFGEYDTATASMLNPKIAWMLPDNSERQLWATSGEYTNGVWMFNDVQFFIRANQTNKLVRDFATTNAIAMPEFDETPARIQLELKFNDGQTLQASRTADIPLAELWEYLRHNPDVSGEDAHRLLTKFHGRLAAPWTCLVVVLIAIPFGAQPGRRNLFFGVAGSIFIVFAFFVLQSVGMALGVGGHLPGWLAAWLPNLIFAILGTALIFRIR
jgi:lipopolysaccharide export system permease protein